MLEQEYVELLGDNNLKCNIMPLFSILEKRIDNPINYENIEELNAIAKELDNEEIRKHLSIIRKGTKKSGTSVLGSYVDSLQKNIKGYTKLKPDSKDRVWKLKKVLCSYLNVTRYIIHYKELENILKRGPEKGEKIVLAIGLVDIKNDDIHVSDEINYLVDSSKAISNYYVIPVHGCTTNIFMSINRKIHADIIHLAGHGVNENGKKGICFVDSKMTYEKLCEKLCEKTKRKRKLIFLNCCHTYEYVNCSAIPISEFSIVHEESVNSNVAFQFSQTFYSELWRVGNISSSWRIAKSVESPLKYKMLMSTL